MARDDQKRSGQDQGQPNVGRNVGGQKQPQPGQQGGGGSQGFSGGTEKGQRPGTFGGPQSTGKPSGPGGTQKGFGSQKDEGHRPPKESDMDKEDVLDEDTDDRDQNV